MDLGGAVGATSTRVPVGRYNLESLVVFEAAGQEVGAIFVRPVLDVSQPVAVSLDARMRAAGRRPRAPSDRPPAPGGRHLRSPHRGLPLERPVHVLRHRRRGARIRGDLHRSPRRAGARIRARVRHRQPAGPSHTRRAPRSSSPTARTTTTSSSSRTRADSRPGSCAISSTATWPRSTPSTADRHPRRGASLFPNGLATGIKAPP